MVLMVELSSASISFSKSSPLDDSLSPVRYSRISFFFCSTVPFSSTSSSSSELSHSKGRQRAGTPTAGSTPSTSNGTNAREDLPLRVSRG